MFNDLALSRDLILKHDNINVGLNETLQELDRALGEHGKSLAHYGLPEPSFHSREVEVELDRWEPQASILAARSANAVSKLNEEQHEIYTEVMDAVENKRPLCAFVDGKAGRGKTKPTDYRDRRSRLNASPYEQNVRKANASSDARSATNIIPPRRSGGIIKESPCSNL